jgi:protein TonB
MMPNWIKIAAFVLALGVHALLFVHLLADKPMSLPPAAALDEGEQGVEVGLGAVGAYEEMLKLEAQAEALAQQQADEQARILELQAIEKAQAAQARLRAIEAKKLAELKKRQEAEQKRREALLEQQRKAEAERAELAAQEKQAQQAAQKQAAVGASQDAQMGGKKGDTQNYFSQLMRALNAHKVYAAQLKRAKIEGTVTLAFTINRQGEVIASSVQQSSGQPALDHAAMEMVKNASPLPPIPTWMNRDTLSLSVPVEYAIKR